MKCWRQVSMLCFSLLSLGTHDASAALTAFPNFPTVDDVRVIYGTRRSPKLPDDDITDDEPAVPIKMTHMRVRSEIALRYARTAIICKVYNPSRRPQEASFNVLLPETAFISGFSMTVGKETYEAYVKEKEEAKQIYKNAVEQGVAAAHVATKARDSNHFTIKFNVEGRSNATYNLKYEEFLVRRNGIYNHAINLLPGTLVPKMDVVINIKESQKITLLRVPELRTGNEIDATDKDAQYSNAVIQRGKNDRQATVTFAPDLVEQKRLAEIYAEKTKQSDDPDSWNIGYDSTEEIEKEGLLGQFVVQYDVEQPKNGEILVNDGYFVHFYAPSSLTPLNKHVVFLFDVSGSMYGTKLEQLKKAMDFILSDLRPGDYFNIIEFNGYIKVYDLQDTEISQNFNSTSNLLVNLVPPAKASPENIATAKSIVSKLDAFGGTDIYTALEVAINVVQNGDLDLKTTNVSLVKNFNETEPTKNKLEPIIIFLSDGDPTVGEINTERIATRISEKNTGPSRVPIFSLAFGDDADRSFLRKLSLRNDGFMRHIYEAADAALQLQDFYRQVSSPLLADVKFVYPRRQIKEGSLSQSQFRTINAGTEVAVVGRTADDVNEITPQMLALRSDGGGRSRIPYEVHPSVSVIRSKGEFLPLERLWAYLTIKQLLDKSDADDTSLSESGDLGADDSAEKKARDIALKFSFVTPLTSLVVVRLNKTDAKPEHLVDAETVDEPKYLAYRHAAAPPIESVRSLTYKAESTPTGLSLASEEGPVLFAVSTKRFTNGGFKSNFDSCSGNGCGQVSYSSQYGSSQSSQFSSGQNSYQSFGYNSYNVPLPPTNHDIPLFEVNRNPAPGGDSGRPLIFSGESGNPAPGGDSDYFPSGLLSLKTTTTTPVMTTSASTSLLSEYHLENYQWVLSAIDINQDAFVWNGDDGTQVTLKLYKDVNPPQPAGGDYQCWPGEPEVLCVYLTRCFAARNYTLHNYQHNYCHVGDGYIYAGICCPGSEIDKKP